VRQVGYLQELNRDARSTNIKFSNITVFSFKYQQCYHHYWCITGNSGSKFFL